MQELTRDELMRRCSERMELTLDDPKRAIPVLDAMGFTSYQVTDKEHIHIFERLSESASLNMELAKAGIPVKGISITSEELEAYFLESDREVSAMLNMIKNGFVPDVSTKSMYIVWIVLAVAVLFTTFCVKQIMIH